MKHHHRPLGPQALSVAAGPARAPLRGLPLPQSGGSRGQGPGSRGKPEHPKAHKPVILTT